MIEVSDVHKRFGEVEALRGVSFEVSPGGVVGFLGPNGAGKTTAMRIVATSLTPDRGVVRVAGFDTVDDPMAVRRRIGYLPERAPVHLDHTVDEYLAFCGGLHGFSGRRLRRRRDVVLGHCGLEEVRGRLIANLSNGYRQRVGLAQALLHDPEVLILDEPTSGLDPQQTREIRGLIRILARERTVLLSTHVLSEVAVSCVRAIVIDRGNVVADADVEQLVARGTLEDAFLDLTTAPRSAAGAGEGGA